MPTLDQFQGCLLGLALGDALGAPFEGGVVERLLWRVIGKTRGGELRWTDDTQMAVDVAESFLACQCFDQDHLAMRFAQSYRWSRGYGPAAGRLLKQIRRGRPWSEANRSIYRDGSFGNGAAMRSPIVGLILWNRHDEIAEMTRATAEITHAHPLGIEGAVMVALATALVAKGLESRDIYEQLMVARGHKGFETRLQTAVTWHDSQSAATPTEVARQLGNGIAAHQSCVTTVYLALRFRKDSFEELQQFVRQVGGDVDTIGAMAGAIWGAANGLGKLPTEPLARLEQRERLHEIASRLYRNTFGIGDVV
jgi:poly(ADP-ribose) glycohydrolase ARH3